jgi:hypothetical protein
MNEDTMKPQAFDGAELELLRIAARRYLSLMHTLETVEQIAWVGSLRNDDPAPQLIHSFVERQRNLFAFDAGRLNALRELIDPLLIEDEPRAR